MLTNGPNGRRRIGQAIRVPRVAAEFFSICSGKIISVLASLILVRITSELLSPEHYGDVSLGLTIATFYGQLVFSGVGPGVSRYYSIANENRSLSSYFYAVHRIVSLTTLFSCVLGAVVSLIAALTVSIYWGTLFAISSCFAIIQGISSTLAGIQNAARQRRIVAVHEAIEGALRIIFTLAILALVIPSPIGVVVGYTLSSGSVCLSQYFLMKKTNSYCLSGGTIKFSSEWSKKISQYSMPFVFWGGFTWLQISSDRWALSLFANDKQVGLYAILFQIGYTPTILAVNLLSTLVGPILFSLAGDATCSDRRRNANKILKNIVFFCTISSFVMFVFCLVFHRQIFNIAVAKEYHEVSYLLPYILMAAGLSSIGQLLSLKVLSDIAPGRLLYPKIGTAVLSTILNAIGASFAGIAGVVIALLLSGVIYSAWMARISIIEQHSRIR